MGSEFQLKVVTPDGAVMDKPVRSLSVTTGAGEITILPEHRLLLSSLEPGPMTAESSDESDAFVLDTGFLEVGPNHANIIADRCVKVADLDREQIDAEIKRLETKLEDADPDDPVTAAAQARLSFALACRLQSLRS